MGSSAESVRVVIFGAEYSIKGDVDVDTTRQVARYLNSKMVEIHENTASRDNLKIAVLSALNIAGELFEARGNNENGAKKLIDFEQRVLSLTQRIDETLRP